MNNKPYNATTFRTVDSIGYLLKVGHTMLLANAENTFRGHDVSFLQWLMMQKIREGHVRTPTDLCRAMHYDSGALTRLVDQLEKSGYLERNRCEEDRRVVKLSLTGAGIAKVDELLPLVVKSLNDCCDGFSDEEFALFKQLLKKLVLRICEVNGQPVPGAMQ